MINKITEFFKFCIDGSWYESPVNPEESAKLLEATMQENAARVKKMHELCKDLPIELQVKACDSIIEHIHYVKEKFARLKAENKHKAGKQPK